MKRLVIALFLVFAPCNALAWMTPIVSGGATAGSGSPPTYTLYVDGSGNVSGTDYTLSGTEYSVGDDVGTMNSGILIDSDDGNPSPSIYNTGSYDNIQFSVSSEDLVDDLEGTVTFDFYITTSVVDPTILFYVLTASESTDVIYVGIDNTDELCIRHEGQNTGNTVCTTTANLATDTWYSATAKWDYDADTNLYISANSSTNTGTTNLTAFNASYQPTAVRIGNAGNGISATFFIDNIKVYKTWQ